MSTRLTIAVRHSMPFSSYWSHTFQYLLTRFVWSVGQIDVTGHIGHVGFTARAWLHDQTAGMSAMLHPSNPVYLHYISISNQRAEVG